MDVLKTMTYEVTERIARITLNRPQRGNGITLDMPRELTECVERAFQQRAAEVGFKQAVHERDDPFGDFGPSTFKG